MSAAIPLPKPRIVALVGNPNCGKTTLFNALTGLHYKVANYPGVTVEKREGIVSLLDAPPATLVDLPGTYAISGSSIDEQIVTRFLSGELGTSGKPDVVLAVVDATNLERNLFLVSQLIDSGIPIVLAINMMDEAKKKGLKLYDELLSRSLDIPVVTITARSGSGLESLKSSLRKLLEFPVKSSKQFAWMPEELSTRPLKSISFDAANYSNSGSPEALRLTLEARHEATLRHDWIRKIVARCVQRAAENSSDRHVSAIDRILMHKVWGLLVLTALFAFMFQAVFLWAATPMDMIGEAVDWTAAEAKLLLPAGLLNDLVSDGIIVGVGNVIVFVPQIAILFLFLGILEDCGYLSRAVFLLDNVMRKFGLQGRSFIPLLSSFACAVPGILATRTISSKSDRIATIMVAPLMSCSARLPVYAVLIAAFIPNRVIGSIFSLQGLVLLALYIMGIAAACAVSWILKVTILKQDTSLLVMEVPPLRIPTVKVVLRGVYDRVMSFIRNATTIILACSILVWFLASFPKVPQGYVGNPVQYSYAGRLGTAIEPAIRPLGFNWELGFAIISSFPAREVFVTSLSTVYNLQEDSEDADNHSLIAALESRSKEGTFSLLTALSLLVFYVFSCQCMSTLAVVRRETNSWSWTAAMFFYMTTLAYLGSLIVYQGGRFLFGMS